MVSLGQNLRAIFWEGRELMDTRQKINFFIFAHNIRFGKLLQEKIVLVSSNLFYGDFRKLPIF